MATQTAIREPVVRYLIPALVDIEQNRPTLESISAFVRRAVRIGLPPADIAGSLSSRWSQFGSFDVMTLDNDNGPELLVSAI